MICSTQVLDFIWAIFLAVYDWNRTHIAVRIIEFIQKIMFVNCLWLWTHRQIFISRIIYVRKQFSQCVSLFYAMSYNFRARCLCVREWSNNQKCSVSKKNNDALVMTKCEAIINLELPKRSKYRCSHIFRREVWFIVLLGRSRNSIYTVVGVCTSPYIGS